MIYLKLYEYYSTETFVEIDSFSFNDMRKNGYADFTDREISKISALLSQNKCELVSKGKILSYRESCDILITKFADEWYGITTSHDRKNTLRYKCDQFDSVVDCLKFITTVLGISTSQI